MVIEQLRHWWHGDPSVVPCKRCGCPIQGRGGQIGKAMRAHYATVHPGIRLTVPEDGAS